MYFDWLRPSKVRGTKTERPKTLLVFILVLQDLQVMQVMQVMQVVSSTWDLRPTVYSAATILFSKTGYKIKVWVYLTIIVLLKNEGLTGIEFLMSVPRKSLYTR
jgi:hypothetical protein